MRAPEQPDARVSVETGQESPRRAGRRRRSVSSLSRSDGEGDREAVEGLLKPLRCRKKAPKAILVAIMRKLIEAANLVLKEQQPWNPATN